MKETRRVFRVDIPKLKSYAAKVASNGVFTSGHPGAVEMLTEIMYAQKGMEKTKLTPEEASNLIIQGGFK